MASPYPSATPDPPARTQPIVRRRVRYQNNTYEVSNDAYDDVLRDQKSLAALERSVASLRRKINAIATKVNAAPIAPINRPDLDSRLAQYQTLMGRYEEACVEVNELRDKIRGELSR
jgi:hypothetical protein